MTALPHRRFTDSQRGLIPFLADWCRYQVSLIPEWPGRVEAFLIRHVVTIFCWAVVSVFWGLLVVGVFA